MRLLRFLGPLRGDPGLPRRFGENLAAAGTAIANNIAEAQTSLSRRQMAHCYRIALREAREAKSSLAVLRDLPAGDPTEVAWLHDETDQFVAILYVSVGKLQGPPL